MPKRFAIFARHGATGLLTGVLGLMSMQMQPLAQRMITPALPAAREIAHEQPSSARKTRAVQDHRAAATASVVIDVRNLPANPPSTLLPLVDQPDIEPRHRIIADRMLRALPSACRTTLESFYVRYDHPEHRGLSSATSMIITGDATDDEFAALIAHECGHVVDLGVLTGTPAAGRSAYVDGTEQIDADDPSVDFYAISWTNATTRKEGVMNRDFVSGYARTDVFEDFAETFAFYALHRDQCVLLGKRSAILQEKFDWMARHVFTDAPIIAHSTRPLTSQPWDVTKLAYAWGQ